MTSARHVARAVGSTGSGEPAYRVELRVGSHHLAADEAAAEGGADTGPTPFGLLLGGLAACTATTLRMYAERKGWALASVEVDARYSIDDAGNRAITRTITLPPEVPAEQRARLGDIAERTPVTLVIRGGVPITTTITSRAPN